jgi:poly-gamma-glutamate capsule biosynthesis protein CapA/YwtB (metallophosphatase superfamily)
MLALLVLGLSQDWTLALGGDLMFNGVRPGPQVLAGVAQVFRDSSDAMANLEVPISAIGVRTQRKSEEALKARTQFILRADPKHWRSLAGSGLTFVTQANNHCMDYGGEALRDETAMLDSLGILHAGAGPNVRAAERTAIRSVPGRPTIGLMSVMAFATAAALRKTTPATINDPGVAVLNLRGILNHASREKLARRVAAAHAGCDVLIVGIHWGVERKPIPIPYQVALGRALIDCGADVVWGHHPHVLEGAEIYRRKPILYSTGNLVSALPADTGVFRLRFREKQFVGIEFLPARDRGGRVTLLVGRAAAARRRAFAGLCRALLKRYPNRNSRAAF